MLHDSNFLFLNHSNNILERYFDNLEKVLKIIRICENGADIRRYLKTDISKKDFKRFN